MTSCIFPPARSEVHLIKQLFLKKFGYEIATEMEICSWEVIAKIIELTSSIGFLPDYVTWCTGKQTSLQLSKTDLNIPYLLYAAYPRDEELTRNARLFLKITHEMFVEKSKEIKPIDPKIKRKGAKMQRCKENKGGIPHLRMHSH